MWWSLNWGYGCDLGSWLVEFACGVCVVNLASYGLCVDVKDGLGIDAK